MNGEDSCTTGLGKIENIPQFVIFAFNLWENVITFSVYNANNIDSTQHRVWSDWKTCCLFGMVFKHAQSIFKNFNIIKCFYKVELFLKQSKTIRLDL